jgi:hypothetical protein
MLLKDIQSNYEEIIKMLTLAEKIEIAKNCCLKTKEYIARKKEEFNDKFLNTEWEVFVVKRDEETGKYVGKFADCARCSV